MPKNYFLMMMNKNILELILFFIIFVYFFLQ